MNIVLVSYADARGVRDIRAHVDDFVLRTRARVTGERMLIKNAVWDVVYDPYPLASENSISATTLVFNAMHRAERMIGSVMGVRS